MQASLLFFLGDNVFVLKDLETQLASDGSKTKFQTLPPRWGSLNPVTWLLQFLVETCKMQDFMLWSQFSQMSLL